MLLALLIVFLVICLLSGYVIYRNYKINKAKKLEKIIEETCREIRNRYKLRIVNYLITRDNKVIFMVINTTYDEEYLKNNLMNHFEFNLHLHRIKKPVTEIVII